MMTALQVWVVMPMTCQQWQEAPAYLAGTVINIVFVAEEQEFASLQQPRTGSDSNKPQ
jgi:hypothetical protein